ncbi:MAG: hypothetical protein ABJF11_14655 [Reichenbachiella sp.]|uniref:hypothetical protein n=1 Tax=Reichenbachiella sp. TaxID=2184521 RepID=UPI00326431EE
MKNKKFDLEDIRKENIHQVPEGYFDELPLKIQSRIAVEQEVSSPLFIPRMQLTHVLTAAIVIFVLGWLFYPMGQGDLSIDQSLAEIDSADLIEYLFEENVSTEDILAVVDQEYLLDEIGGFEPELFDESLSEEELESIFSEMDDSIEFL